LATPECSGDLEYLPFWAGQSFSLVDLIKPAGEIVRDVVREAEAVIDRLARIRSSPEPV